MFNKRKRSTKSWSVRAIETMLVMVAAVITASIICPPPQTTEIRVIEIAPQPQIETVTITQSSSDALIDASYQAALDYMRSKDYFKSAGLLEVITDEAEHYWAHVTYSFVLYEMGQYDHAIAIASEGIKINPHDPVAWNNRCLLQSLLGNFEDGLRDCNHSIAVDPHYDYSYNNRCYVLTEMGYLEEAEQSCLQALKNGHRMPEWVYTNLGNIALKRGLDNPAMEMFMTALEYNPQHADAYAGMGDVMLIKSSFTKALEYYDLYRQYAGVHYNSDSYDVKIAYALDALAFAGQN